MTPSLTVEPLAHRRELIGTVAEWFASEWPAWYGPDGQGDLAADLESFARADAALPVGLVVFERGKPVGAAVLKAESIPSHRHLGPWAAAGYVLPSHRGRGVGAFLLQGLVERANLLGFSRIYCGTRTANRLLERSGWDLIETTMLQGEPLGIYRSQA